MFTFKQTSSIAGSTGVQHNLLKAFFRVNWSPAGMGWQPFMQHSYLVQCTETKACTHTASPPDIQSQELACTFTVCADHRRPSLMPWVIWMSRLQMSECFHCQGAHYAATLSKQIPGVQLSWEHIRALRQRLIQCLCEGLCFRVILLPFTRCLQVSTN